jgi:hypothetical protein
MRVRECLGAPLQAGVQRAQGRHVRGTAPKSTAPKFARWLSPNRPGAASPMSSHLGPELVGASILETGGFADHSALVR